MKQYYELKIKPLNDKLGKDLGVKSIEVTKIERVQHVPVTVQLYTGNGHYIYVRSGKVRDYRALGLPV